MALHKHKRKASSVVRFIRTKTRLLSGLTRRNRKQMRRKGSPLRKHLASEQRRSRRNLK